MLIFIHHKITSETAKSIQITISLHKMADSKKIVVSQSEEEMRNEIRCEYLILDGLINIQSSMPCYYLALPRRAGGGAVWWYELGWILSAGALV